MRILFMNRNLRIGGAERQLVALARGLRRAGHEVAIAVFYGGGEFEEEVRSDGISVHDLGKRSRWESAAFMARVVRLVQRARPELLHSYMQGSNIVSAALKGIFPSMKVVWGIRTSMPNGGGYGWLPAAGARIERLASPMADAIIANSEAARRSALASGLDRHDIFVIPNGIDCESFRPDPAGRERLRREWGLRPDAEVVGLVARLNPVKDHRNFLHAAARIAAARADVWFACIGGGQPEYRRRLEQLATDLAIAPRLIWIGERRATRAEYSALDIAVLSSEEGEGFPNVVAEAMACGRPVVATDSGDARSIVGDTGEVVPPRNPEALAGGILQLLDRTRAGPQLSSRARARIEAGFSVPILVDRTARVLEQVRAWP